MRVTLAGLFLIALCTGGYAQGAGPLAAPLAGPLPGPVTPPPAPTMAQDLDEIVRLIQFKPLKQLVVRYLLNDAEFQAFVRIINSNAGFVARWRLLSQPELVQFQRWVSQQIMASGGKFEFEEHELTITLFNRFPYWSGTVMGWQGFLSEMQLYFPQYMIRAHIDAKVMQQGIFAQFWTRLQGLQVVYERWLGLPGTITLVDQLQAAGIDTIQLDGIIRELFGWNAVNGTSTVGPPAAATSSSPPGTEIIL